MAGRPTTYNIETAEIICEQVATTSKSMKTICEEIQTPVRTVLGWLASVEEFSHMYTRAKEQQADFLAEEMLDIADDGSNDYMKIVKGDMEYNVENKEVVSRSRLRVEARKWIASKLKPKKYGEKLDMTSDGKELNPIVLNFIKPDDRHKDD